MANQLDEHEHEELEEIINHCTENLSKLTEWEKTFIEDMRDRFEKYSENTWVSPRQWEILRKLYDKCQNE